MSTQNVTITLPTDVVYVSGSVNGVEYTWTNTTGNTWEAVVERSQDETYVVVLEIIDARGTTTSEKFTLYYSVLNLITDRTRADVERWKALRNKCWLETTDNEKSEWLTPMKGCYNSNDLNRVESAVQYISELFVSNGYYYFVPKVKTSWSAKDRPTVEDMERYFANVEKLRSTLPLYSTTPSAPTIKNKMDWQVANDLEQILLDVHEVITKLIESWYYSGDLYVGEV